MLWRIGRLLFIIILLGAGCLKAAAGEPANPLKTREVIVQSPETAVGNSNAGLNIAGVFTILGEGFSTADMPPAGWQVTSFSESPFKWTIADTSVYTGFVHSGAYAAWVNWDGTMAQDEWLFSPWFAVPVSTTATTLSFWALSSTNFLTATVTLYIEDGFQSSSAWDLANMNWLDMRYRQVLVDLSPYQGQTIRLVWRYHGVDGESFGLDDIVVTGPAQGLFIPLALKP